jgi:hypothetical protein
LSPDSGPLFFSFLNEKGRYVKLFDFGRDFFVRDRVIFDFGDHDFVHKIDLPEFLVVAGFLVIFGVN